MTIAVDLGRKANKQTNKQTKQNVHHFIEIFTGNPLKYKMDYSILIVSICMG